MVDVKEYTSGGRVVNNVMDASGLMGQHYAVSCMNVKGNAYLIQGNKCTKPLGNGYVTHTVVPGWGAFNTFKANKCAALPPGKACVRIISAPFPGAPRAAMGNVVS